MKEKIITIEGNKHQPFSEVFVRIPYNVNQFSAVRIKDVWTISFVNPKQ